MLLRGSDYTFQHLADGPLLRDTVTDDEFLDYASVLLGNLNYLHPFREGNGRAQRAFLDAVAARSGRKLTWRNVSEEENIAASIASFDNPHSSALKQLLAKVIQPPFDRRPILDDGVYLASAPMAVTDTHPDSTGGMTWLRRNNGVDTGRCGAPTRRGAACRRIGRCPHHGQ